MEKINVGLIGCGRISGKHLLAIKYNPHTELVAVCDIIPERAKKAAEENNCKYYLDYKGLLRDKDIDMVSICTPSGLHPSMAIDSLDAGKHVLSEKPMALKTEDAIKMIEASKKNNRKLFVVQQNRFNFPVMELKKAINEKRFGKLVLLNTSVKWRRLQDYYDQDEWSGTREMDGGVLSNQAHHHLDLISWLGGEVESVFSYASTRTHKIEVEDTAVVLIKFKNGALGTIEATTCTSPRDIEASLTVLGEKGSVKIGGFAVNETEIWDFEKFQEGDNTIIEKSSGISSVYGFGHKKVYDHISDCLINNKESFLEGTKIIKTIILLDAIYRSIKDKKEVYL